MKNNKYQVMDRVRVGMFPHSDFPGGIGVVVEVVREGNSLWYEVAAEMPDGSLSGRYQLAEDEIEGKAGGGRR